MPSSNRSRSMSRHRSRSSSRSYSRSRSRSYSPQYRESRPARPRDNPDPSKILGVFGLDARTDERDLQEYFDRPDFGKVENIQIIKDQVTRRSKRFGFIYYTSVKAASLARDAMNGKVIHGREIRVDFSTTKGPHEPGSRPPMSRERSPPRHRNDNTPPNRCIGIFNLHPQTTERELSSRFERFGPIEQARVIKDRYTNHSKGFGFVYFLDTRAAIDAKRRMDGREFDGSNIRVDFSATNARNERMSPRSGRGRSPPRRNGYDSRRRSMSPPPRRQRSRSPVRRRSRSPVAHDW